MKPTVLLLHYFDSDFWYTVFPPEHPDREKAIAVNGLRYQNNESEYAPELRDWIDNLEHAALWRHQTLLEVQPAGAIVLSIVQGY